MADQAHGLGVDVTESERKQTATAAALRRLGVLDDMLWRLRNEVLPPMMIVGALSVLAAAVQAEGAAIIRAPVDRTHAQAGAIRHRAGADAMPVLQAALDLANHAVHAPVAVPACGSELLACPCLTRFRPPEVLVLWRASAAGSWTTEERNLVVSATALIRLVLEHDALQQEMSTQSRNDPVTGLCNRSAFLDELARRIDRLEREELPGTLLIIGMDDLDHLNARAAWKQAKPRYVRWPPCCAPHSVPPTCSANSAAANSRSGWTARTTWLRRSARKRCAWKAPASSRVSRRITDEPCRCRSPSARVGRATAKKSIC